ncbi:uncharacterized protein SCHCODRAFT_02519622 [Schizophyllum commune H4-8]|uniref:Uncharacterized protein n=1 Tax=Schizophyllum commune (strain H4-8 / FGSC 9210) TaxID=578458 RepID=D8QIL8_SCHCM|nr:uncharacterized protein SCHCODRAFT_02519622 [Schizophyllum commune H4-8]KAI5886045.1 hypothetical protein SCHCODRAFT_02519622 [Schizophyllum commune H4-8]
MVSFLLRPNAARLPLFAASYKHYKQWVSIGGDPADLDHLNPEDRRVPYYLRLPSTRLAYFNHGLPWEGYMPCSLVDGLDLLQPLIRRPLASEVINAEGGKYWVVASWVIEICEIAGKVEAACRAIHEQAGDLFKRGEEASPPDYQPLSFGPQRLEIGFNTREEAEARVELVRAAALCNTAFLAWFTSIVHSWHLRLSDDTAEFIRSLRLEEREMRGYVLNLAIDFPWIDLQLLIEHGVPIHYAWSPPLHNDLRFTRANPWLIARVLEMRKQLGREPSDEEVLKGQNSAKAVLEYDRWFQPRYKEVDLTPVIKSREEPENYVQLFYGWHPHPLNDKRVLEGARGVYQMGDPRSIDDMETCLGDINVIYRWAKKGATWVEDDELEDWAIFDVPESYQRGDFMHGRELRRLTCAPLPSEMYDEPVIQGRDKEVINTEYYLLEACAGEPSERETWEAWWSAREDEIPRFVYDSREGCDQIPEVPIAQGNRYHRYDSDCEGEPSLLKRMELPPPSPKKQKPLIERLGPAVAASLEAGPSGSTRRESTSRERGRSRARASPREPAQASGSRSARRSASPPRTRAASSLSSSAAASTSSRDYAIAIPDPSMRWGVVYPPSERWNDLLAQHLREVEILSEVLTAKIRPRSADVEGRIRWASIVLKEGYIVLLHAQHQVRMYVWRVLGQHRSVEDFLEQFANTGVPLSIALPQALYPSPDQDQALGDEETHSATFPAYGVGGKDLFARWKDCIRSLARKPYAGALYFASDIASFVLRRYAWDLVAAKVGEGPCEETRLHRSGTKYFRGGPFPSLFCDYSSSEELALLHGCIVAVLNADKTTHRHAFPPHNVWAAHWPTKGEWGVEEQKYLTELAEAFEQGIAEIPPENLWRERLRSRSRSAKGSGFRKADALQAADASAWAAHFEKIYGGDRRFVRIADLGERLRPQRLFE